MGFWLFMLAMALLTPLMMLAFGWIFLKRPPKMGGSFGYRSARSMASPAAWAFAHRYCGRLWFYSGLFLLPASVIIMLCLLGRDVDTVGMSGGILCLLQTFPLAGAIIPTERALKKHFF